MHLFAAFGLSLFQRLETGRFQPLRLGGGFNLPRSAEQLVTPDPRRRAAGFPA
ncbi:hypothetical protein V1278_005284 [Bradyrhizobium sp. AZCC 1577]